MYYNYKGDILFYTYPGNLIQIIKNCKRSFDLGKVVLAKIAILLFGNLCMRLLLLPQWLQLDKMLHCCSLITALKVKVLSASPPDLDILEERKDVNGNSSQAFNHYKTDFNWFFDVHEEVLLSTWTVLTLLVGIIIYILCTDFKKRAE